MMVQLSNSLLFHNFVMNVLSIIWINLWNQNFLNYLLCVCVCERENYLICDAGLSSNNCLHHCLSSPRNIMSNYCRNTGEFMMSRYREVAEIVLRYLEHRDRLVRLSITSLLPRIAHFLRDRFVTNYLTVGLLLSFCFCSFYFIYCFPACICFYLFFIHIVISPFLFRW